MKYRLTILVVFALLSISLVAGRNNKKVVDEDEFGEFDNFDEIDQTKTSSQQKQQQQQHQQEKKKESREEFSNFDEAFIEEDDDDINNNDEEFEKPKQKQENPSSTFSSSSKSSSNSNKKDSKSSSFGTSNDLVDDLDMEEFEHFVDDKDFDDIETSQSSFKDNKKNEKTSKGADSKSQNQMPNLKIADVPKHLMTNGNWQNYVWEIVMLVVIFIYFANFLYGKSKNYRLATAWYQSHRELLERNFFIVGDNGMSPELTVPKKQNDEETTASSSANDSEIGTLIKDSENSYGLWCTGRQTCDGMLAQLKLVKRQDLINGVLMQLIKPQSDQIIISIEYPVARDTLDSFVFCLANKKQSQKLFNDYQDLNSYSSEKKLLPNTGNSKNSEITSYSGDYKYAEMLNPSVASKYVMLNECGEIPNAIMDMRVCAFLNKYPEMIEYLLISDQYVGYKVQINDDQTVSGPNTSGAGTTGNESSPVASTLTDDASTGMGLPKSRPILLLCLNVPGKGFNTTVEDMELMQPALQLALYLIDKAPRIRLSREAKAKAIKKRKAIAEQFMKISHKQRQEEIMLRKEEKRRAEKEKIMNEEDPEKQKRLEEKEIKREKKKNLSKMKQVKIKSM